MTTPQEKAALAEAIVQELAPANARRGEVEAGHRKVRDARKQKRRLRRTAQRGRR